MLSQCRLPARGCWGGVGCVEGEGVRGKPTISQSVLYSLGGARGGGNQGVFFLLRRYFILLWQVWFCLSMCLPLGIQR